MEIDSPFAKPNLLALASDEDPNNRDKFEEQNDSTEQEQGDPKESKGQTDV